MSPYAPIISFQFAAEAFVATSSNNSKPKFSAGLVTALVTIVWLVVFGAAMIHGSEGIQQHDHIIAQGE